MNGNYNLEDDANIKEPPSHLLGPESHNTPSPHATGSNRHTFLFQRTANQSATFIFMQQIAAAW